MAKPRSIPDFPQALVSEGEGSSQSEAANTDWLDMIMLSHPVPHENSAPKPPLR